MNLADYRAEAERFVSDLDREYYLHFAGHRDEFAIEPIYERHAGLFAREVVEELRAAGERELARFAAEGYIGRSLKAESAELARLEAALVVELDGERHPYRQAAIVQANEPAPARRRALEVARNELLAARLSPLLVEVHERSRALAAELGWSGVRAMTEELSGIDLGALQRLTEGFLERTEERYEEAVEPCLRAQLGLGFDELRRADLPAFFRAPSLDASFPASALLRSLDETRAGLGIDSGERVIVDAEARPKKSPRAFCSPVRVPDEVYLVIAPAGGRDDYEALFHEAGHAEHYAHVDRALPFEQRYLGDNAVTEGFAFLMQHLTADRDWLARRLGVADPEPIAAQARASKLVFLRRYCAKLGYELELHGERPPTAPDELYARRLSEAVHVDWPRETWLSDVDAFFYAAAYLRAWALETHLRRVLEERFGQLWFEEPEAGRLLQSLWAQGQRVPAEELLGELTGARLDFSLLLDEVGAGDAGAAR